jgi:hypothetical protein
MDINALRMDELSPSQFHNVGLPANLMLGFDELYFKIGFVYGVSIPICCRGHVHLIINVIAVVVFVTNHLNVTIIKSLFVSVCKHRNKLTLYLIVILLAVMFSSACPSSRKELQFIFGPYAADLIAKIRPAG